MDDSIERKPGRMTDTRPRRRLSLAPILSILLVWTAAWWVIVGALVAPVVPGGGWTVLAAAMVATAPLAVLARAIGGSAYPSAATRVWIFRPFWYAQLALPLLGLAGVAGVIAGLPFGASGRLGRGMIEGVAALLVAAAAWGYVGTRRLVVRRMEVRLPALPPGLEGMRIAQLSDLHVGPHTSRRHLARVARAVMDAAPDLIALTGDQVDDYARDVEPFAAAFGSLAAPLGVFAIAGNHDVYAGWSPVRRGLEGMGIAVLVNSAVELRRGGDRFALAGTGDPAGGQVDRGGAADAAPDIERTLAAVPAGAFAIVLAHNPALWPPLAAAGVPLTLSGHTHHGQLSIPALRWSVASPFLEHAMGAHRDGNALLYINPGTNYWGIPFRIGALPEVTVLTLRRASPAAVTDESGRRCDRLGT